MAKSLIPDELVASKILHIRGLNVIIDDDLADLYQVPTKRLNEQVKRNPERFPEDFMFQLSPEEWTNLRSQIATSNPSRGGRRYTPFVFTEHGVLMLSSVLNSKRAIQINIQIMRVYNHLRKMLVDHSGLLRQFEKLEKKVGDHDNSIKSIFDYIRQLLTPETSAHRKIGFRRKSEPETNL